MPYFRQPSIHLFGPVTLHGFGFLVALAVVAGWQLALRRCKGKKLDAGVCDDLLMWGVVSGFIFAHLYSVLAYFPSLLLEDPLLLLKFWENISSFGGIVGGVLGFWLFFRWKTPHMARRTRWEYLDALAFVFPFAWAIGRLGCTVAHDHPGTLTTFPLGVGLRSPEAREFIVSIYREAGRLAELPPADRLAKMAFHDLGWYEFLYTVLVIVPAFLLLDRRPRAPGFYVAAFLALYVPVRFGLDFLRFNDARYCGLTPGQYGGIAVFLAALLLLLRNRDKARRMTPNIS